MRVEGIKASKVNTPLTLDVKIEREVGACEIFFVSKEKSLPFRFFDSDKGVDTYTLTLEEKKRGLTEWHLEVSLGDKTLFSNSLNNADFTLKEEKGAPFTLLFHLPLSVPSFLSGSVIYQIFPDRFRKG
ncbi:MAG: hypothetical protein IIV81_02835, partial [Clostridia bacterium]|nr:hypothetical protein [Clostridia bacterium]